MDGIKVLIVEDDRMLSAIFQMFIRELGHELIGIVSEGDAAIDLCSRQLPDIILMDIHLKGDKDGIMTARELGLKYQIPIIYITGDYDEHTVPNSLLHNTYGFLVKPLYKSTLGVAIQFALQKFAFDRKTFIPKPEQKP
jgi:response regulator of citrate/malate metabolism